MHLFLYFWCFPWISVNNPCACLHSSGLWDLKRLWDPLGVKDSCEPSCGCCNLNLGPQQECQMFLTTEPSLQLLFLIKKKKIFGLKRCLSGQEHLLLLQRTQVQLPAPIATLNSSTRGLNTLFWAPWAPHVHGAETYMQAKTHIYIK